jgi:hypothetical protein
LKLRGFKAFLYSNIVFYVIKYKFYLIFSTR